MWLVSAVMLALAQPAEAVEPGPVTEADLASAWASGDMRMAAPVFLNAFDDVSNSACAISPYAAQLAYRTGVLDWSGYHFHMAVLIDAQVGGLSAGQREIAQEMRSQPGDYQSEDQFYVFSPYLDAGQTPGVCPDRRFPDLPPVATGQGERAVVMLRGYWRGPSYNRELSQVVLLDAYPPEEGPDLASRLTGLKTDYEEARGWSLEAFVFSPCYQYVHRRSVEAQCRPGFERETSSTD